MKTGNFIIIGHNFNPLTRIIPAKFILIWFSGFRAKDLNVIKICQICIVCINLLKKKTGIYVELLLAM